MTTKTIPNIIITLAVTIGEILNDRDEKRDSKNYFTWTVWKIDAEILNLLSGRSYCKQPPQTKYLKQLIGCHLAPHQDYEESASRYFHCVFEHEFSKRAGGKTPSIIPLQEIIRSHCLDRNKQQEENLFPASIWRVFTRAGETQDERTAPHYRYFSGADLDSLKLRLIATIASANRHYAELYRLGLYPPEYINHIKVSQARELHELLAAAKARAQQDGGTWQSHLPAVWALKPMKKIGSDKCPNYHVFAQHDIIRSILGLRPPLRFVAYEDNEQSNPKDNSDGAPNPEWCELIEDNDDFITEYHDNLALLKKRLDRATYLNRRDRELLTALIYHRDLSHLVREAEQERTLVRLEKLLHQLIAPPDTT